MPTTKADVVTFELVTHFTLTAYNHIHSAVLLLDIEACQVIVYDGLSSCLKKWEDYISYILRKYGLQDYKDMPHVKLTTSADCNEVLEIIKYILCPSVPKVQITKADVVTFEQVTHFVSTVYNHSHFAVLLFDLEAH